MRSRDSCGRLVVAATWRGGAATSLSESRPKGPEGALCQELPPPPPPPSRAAGAGANPARGRRRISGPQGPPRRLLPRPSAAAGGSGAPAAPEPGPGVLTRQAPLPRLSRNLGGGPGVRPVGQEDARAPACEDRAAGRGRDPGGSLPAVSRRLGLGDGGSKPHAPARSVSD